MGCGCLSFGMQSCTTAPITERRQLKLIPESKLNAQAAQIYEKIKEKEKLIDDENLTNIKIIGKRMQDSINEYFYQSGLPDPTTNFDWEYHGRMADATCRACKTIKDKRYDRSCCST